jgi:hypothetical protein
MDQGVAAPGGGPDRCGIANVGSRCEVEAHDPMPGLVQCRLHRPADPASISRHQGPHGDPRLPSGPVQVVGITKYGPGMVLPGP